MMLDIRLSAFLLRQRCHALTRYAAIHCVFQYLKKCPLQRLTSTSTSAAAPAWWRSRAASSPRASMWTTRSWSRNSASAAATCRATSLAPAAVARTRTFPDSGKVLASVPSGRCTTWGRCRRCGRERHGPGGSAICSGAGNTKGGCCCPCLADLRRGCAYDGCSGNGAGVSGCGGCGGCRCCCCCRCCCGCCCCGGLGDWRWRRDSGTASDRPATDRRSSAADSSDACTNRRQNQGRGS